MRPELLAPAGDLNTARVALRFGADAIYLGGTMLQLRAKSAGFSLNDLETAVREAHGMNRKVYVTVNAFARDDELEDLSRYAAVLRDLGADAAIISDPGVMSLFHESAPELPVHVSTQANCTNSAAAKAYYALGARRVVPARELTLEQLARMRAELPQDMEIEAFIHGAMCMSYSGRCMISAFLTGRSANRGECTHPCRWKYTLMEQSRPGEYFPAEETEDGMAIFSSYDLNCMAFLDQLVDAGIASFKIEGRMKSEYYVATVVNAYRRRLDDILEGRASDLDLLRRELDSVSHRPYSSGFYFGALKHVGGDGGEYLQRCAYAACVKEVQGDRAVIELKNKFAAGDKLELVAPGKFGTPFRIETLYDMDGAPVPEASVPARLYQIALPKVNLAPGDLLRKPL